MKRPNSLRYLLAAAAAIALATACHDGANLVGSSIVDDEVNVVVDSAFTVTGSSLRQASIQSRTLTQLLGKIDIKGYGSLSSTVVTQFMPASRIDTAGITAADIDSLHLVLAMNRTSIIGDSIIPMGLAVYPLTEDLPYPIYSDFNPTGKYDKSKPLGATIYNVSNLTKPDSVARKTYYTVDVNLPLEFGRKLFNDYMDDPTSFATPNTFIDRVFKGVYMDNTYGSGRLMGVASTTMELFYHHTYYDKDRKADTTVYKSNIYLGVTPEIITNNNLTLSIDPAVTALAESGEVITMSPIGYEARITFPGRELVEKYRTQFQGEKVLNSLTFSIPASEIENEGDITVPTYMLLIKESEREKFFAENKMNDNVTSFYAQYSTKTKSYNFNSMRDYMLDLLDKEEITDEDVTFLLIPVQINFESNQGSSYSSYYYSYYYGLGGSSSTATSITPLILPSMAKINPAEAKIKLTYCVQSQNF